jgi:hypothetical protein
MYVYNSSVNFYRQDKQTVVIHFRGWCDVIGNVSEITSDISSRHIADVSRSLIRVKQRAWEGAIMGQQDGEIYTKRYREVALCGIMRFVIACVPSPLVMFHQNPDSLLYIILIFTSRCFRSGKRIRSILDQHCVHVGFANYSYIIAVQD